MVTAQNYNNLKLVDKKNAKFICHVDLDECRDDFESLLPDLEQSLFGFSCGETREGTVTKIHKDKVYFDVKMKNIGRVLIDEFIVSGEAEDLKVGNKYDLLVERIDDFNGCAVLSREKALKKALIPFFKHAKENDESIEGSVCGKVKGGLMVNIKGVLAFLPGSQIDVRPVRDFLPLIGKVQMFKILTIDDQHLNIIVSRKAVFDASRAKIQEAMLSNLEVGQIITGSVKNITPYGAFIDLGDLDGLLHLTDMSWKRISHPSEMLTIGQEVNVIIIRINKEGRRISLGMKQLAGNPWDDIDKRIKVGEVINGTITNIADYGVFVDVGEGIEGLVHAFEASWVRFGCHLNNVFKKGQKINAKVLGIDKERNRISLSIKRCTSNPWTKFVESHRINQVIKGVVNNVVEFGVFVTLDGCVDGLVHVTDLSWKKTSLPNALSKFKDGDAIDVKILSMDAEKNRIGLGVRQIEKDPYHDFLCNLKEGDAIHCMIESVEENRLEVSVIGSEGVAIQMQKELFDFESDNLKLSDIFKSGSEIDFIVFSVDPSRRFLRLLREKEYKIARENEKIGILVNLFQDSVVLCSIKEVTSEKIVVKIDDYPFDESFDVLASSFNSGIKLSEMFSVGLQMKFRAHVISIFESKIELKPLIDQI